MNFKLPSDYSRLGWWEFASGAKRYSNIILGGDFEWQIGGGGWMRRNGPAVPDRLQPSIAKKHARNPLGSRKPILKGFNGRHRPKPNVTFSRKLHSKSHRTYFPMFTGAVYKVGNLIAYKTGHLVPYKVTQPSILVRQTLPIRPHSEIFWSEKFVQRFKKKHAVQLTPILQAYTPGNIPLYFSAPMTANNL